MYHLKNKQSFLAVFSTSVFLLSVAAFIAGCSDSNDAMPTGESSQPAVVTRSSAISSAIPSATSSTATSSISAAVDINEKLSGGEASRDIFDSSAYSHHSANIGSLQKVRTFNVGNDFFENPWVPSRSSTSLRDGLGPLFNNNACQDCHIRDGRGHGPNVSELAEGTDFSSMLLRVSRSAISGSEQAMMREGRLANVGDTAFGNQIQHLAVAGIPSEATLQVSYEPIDIVFDDGYRVTLRKPLWHIQNNAQATGVLNDADSIFSARVAPPMIGMGLLELIPESAILANSDTGNADDDANTGSNGISGRPNYVWSIEKEAVMLGRFGWKAGQPSVREQAAGAFIGDMGLTSRLHPIENCLPYQVDCQQAPNGNGDSTRAYDYEVFDNVLEQVTFYSSHLAVPMRRNPNDEQVQRGKALFVQAGCEACHTPMFETGEREDLPELSGQVIFPYTNMLLHDMGPELADFFIDNTPAGADHLVEFSASAAEWRTPPLWGIGLAQTVDPEATFLHDGRARTLMEAVLWHGGEAQAARDHVLTFDASDRAALLAFLNDL